MSSYWQNTRAPSFECVVPGAADIVIVGAGVSGLSTAIDVLRCKPKVRVVVLEANTVGYGASGRSAGLLSPLGAPIWLITAKTVAEHAWATTYLNRRVAEVAHWLAAHVPTCEVAPAELRLRGKGKISRAGILHLHDLLALLGISAVVENQREEAHLALAAHSVNPYRLTCGLAELAQNLGATIVEGANVTSIGDGKAGVRVMLSTGQVVDANRAVVCTNAYTSSIRLPSRPKVHVVSCFALTTEPVAEKPQRLRDNAFVAELASSQVFYRTHADRIVFGGFDRYVVHPSDDGEVSSNVRAKLWRRLVRTFPEVKHGAPAYVWSGRYCWTLTDLPILRPDDKVPNVILNFGYGGTGLAVSLACSQIVARMALDVSREDELSAFHGVISRTTLPIGPALRLLAELTWCYGTGRWRQA